MNNNDMFPILVPVLNPDGSPMLYDIFIDDKWFGSRRTMHQARQYIDFLTRT